MNSPLQIGRFPESPPTEEEEEVKKKRRKKKRNKEEEEEEEDVKPYSEKMAKCLKEVLSCFNGSNTTFVEMDRSADTTTTITNSFEAFVLSRNSDFYICGGKDDPNCQETLSSLCVKYERTKKNNGGSIVSGKGISFLLKFPKTTAIIPQTPLAEEDNTNILQQQQHQESSSILNLIDVGNSNIGGQPIGQSTDIVFQINNNSEKNPQQNISNIPFNLESVEFCEIKVLCAIPTPGMKKKFEVVEMKEEVDALIGGGLKNEQTTKLYGMGEVSVFKVLRNQDENSIECVMNFKSPLKISRKKEKERPSRHNVEKGVLFVIQLVFKMNEIVGYEKQYMCSFLCRTVTHNKHWETKISKSAGKLFPIPSFMSKN